MNLRKGYQTQNEGVNRNKSAHSYVCCLVGWSFVRRYLADREPSFPVGLSYAFPGLIRRSATMYYSSFRDTSFLVRD